MVTITCKVCKRAKPEDQFLWNGRKGSIRVRHCNECAGENMKKYWRTRMVGRKAEEFTDGGD